MTGKLFDIDRVSEWLAAVERWEAGDPEAVVLFVRRNGVQEDYEREDIIRMLTTKPDKRLVVKQNTKGILRDLESYERQRERQIREDILHLHTWVKRLRVKLAARGLTDEQITELLARRKPGYLSLPKPPTLEEMFSLVAARHGITVEAVKKTRQRHHTK